jgi:hypothetical protein
MDIEGDASGAIMPRKTVGIGGHTWGSIYDLDFQAHPQLVTFTAGLNMVGEAKVYQKGNSAFGVPTTCSVVPGEGLRLAGGAWAGSGDYPYPMVWFPFSQVAAYNPLAPVAVAWTYSPAALTTSKYVVAGLTSTADNGNVYAIADRQREVVQRYAGGGLQYEHFNGNSDALGISPVPFAYTDPLTENHAFVEARVTSDWFGCMHARYAGEMPSNLHLITDGMQIRTNPFAKTNLGFCAMTNKGSAFEIYIRKIRLLQPKAA